VTGAIHGRVVAEDGRPLSGASVAVQHAAGPVPDIAALTGADGTFELGGLPPGEVTLQAHLASGQTARARVQVTANSVASVTITVDNGWARNG